MKYTRQYASSPNLNISNNVDDSAEDHTFFETQLDDKILHREPPPLIEKRRRGLYGNLKQSESVPNLYGGIRPHAQVFGKHSFSHSPRDAGNYDKSLKFLQQRIRNGFYGDGIACMPDDPITISFRIDLQTDNTVKHLGCKSRFIIYHVSIYYPDSAHANMLIVDTETQTAERFEPHGFKQSQASNINDIMLSINTSSASIDAHLQRWIKQNYPNYTYLSPFDVCPRTGPQTTATSDVWEKGFCQTWTILYADARLRSPDLSPEEIQGLLLQYSPDQLHDLVRTFANIVDVEVEGKANSESLHEWITRLSSMYVLTMIDLLSPLNSKALQGDPDLVKLLVMIEHMAPFIERSLAMLVKSHYSMLDDAVSTWSQFALYDLKDAGQLPRTDVLVSLIESIEFLRPVIINFTIFGNHEERYQTILATTISAKLFNDLLIENNIDPEQHFVKYYLPRFLKDSEAIQTFEDSLIPYETLQNMMSKETLRLWMARIN